MIEILGRPIIRPHKGYSRVYFIYHDKIYFATLFSAVSEREGDCIFISHITDSPVLRYDEPYCVSLTNPVVSLNRVLQQIGQENLDAAIQQRLNWLRALEESDE